MGLFKKKEKKQEIPKSTVTYGEEMWVGGTLRVEKFRKEGDGAPYKSFVEPQDIVDARKALERVKRVKLKHSKSERQAIVDLVDGGDSGGLGELVREPSTSGECHYRAMYKGKDVGLLPSDSVAQVKQCYGLYERDDFPEHVACKIVLRVYDEGGGWSTATIL